jgi:hypothetical protein
VECYILDSDFTLEDTVGVSQPSSLKASPSST